MKNNRMSSDAFLYFLAQICLKAVSFILLPLYTKYILPEELGGYEYIRSYTTLLTVFSGLGLSTYYLKAYSSKKNKHRFTGAVFSFVVVWNLVLIIIEIIVIPLIMRILNAPINFYPYMLISLITLFTLSFEIIPMRDFRIRGEVKKFFAISVIKAILQLGLIILFLVHFQLGVIGRYFTELIIGFILAIVFAVYIYKNHIICIDGEIVKEGLIFSLPLVPSELLQIISTSLITILVEKMLSVTELGLYSIGLSISAIINVFTNALWFVIEPNMYINSNRENFSEYFIRLKKIYMAITAAICVGSGLFVKEAVFLLLNEKYYAAWPIVQILSFSYIMSGLSTLYMQLLIIQGKTKQAIWVNLFKILANVLACAAFAPFFHLNAFGWSYFMGYLMMFISLLIFVDKDKKREKSLVTDVVIICMSGIVILLSHIINSANIIENIAGKLLLYFVFTFLVIRLYNINILNLVNVKKKGDN